MYNMACVLKIRLVLALTGALALAACSTTSEIQYAGDQKGFGKNARFEVTTTVDQSGFIFEDTGEAFALDQAFSQALQAAVNRKGLTGQGMGAYTLKSEVIHYKPGNAFTRWLLPGAGATELVTVTHVFDSQKREVATIPVNTMIAVGGAYTIGAYKTVFTDNANQVADKLREGVTP